MRPSIALWAWRVSVIVALGWLGLELHRIHEDLLLPQEDPAGVSADAGDLQDHIDDLRDDVASLTQKVDALMIATAQLKK